MAFRNGSLIPPHDPSTRENQSSSPTIQRGTVPTNTEITIEKSNHPQFLKTIDDLTAFSAAVDAFKRHYDDLQSHMDYIKNAIDSSLKSKGITAESPSSRSQSPRNDASGETVAATQSPPVAEKVERLCELMCSKGLRRYMYSNISDRAKLIEELPAALKLAKEPANFVLECIGKFYLQGRKAYASDSHMIPARQVSLLILESYLLMLDPKKPFDRVSIKDQAEAAAVAWKKRMMSEGRLAAAEAMDARGLLLLIACFGIPSSFTSMDLFDLVRKSGAAEIAAALKRSPFLVPMMSGIVDSSIKRGKHIEALGMIYTFGIEDRFSASSLLTSFLRMSKESFERAKQKAQAPIAFNEANQKFLAALLSVMKCLEAHNLDPEREVQGWQIKEQMIKLEKDIIQLDKQMEGEARSISLMEEVALTKRFYNQQMKRPRLSDMEMPPAASSSYSSTYPDRSFPSHRDNEISALVSSYLGPSSGFPHRSSLRRSPEYLAPSSGLGRSVPAYEHLPPNSYLPLPGRHSPVQGQRLPGEYTPPIHGQQQIPYGLQRVYRHSPSVERYLALPKIRSPRNS
ncbi:hypothetical protein IGI04_039907 [Brassica rapa subsp. trilocularis]|uniref:FRIGIDA-like protein n=1 Tax=Brassica rapa subsp. trilocularis TaxID=1813537 RepID=A0ABQ7KP95_BRACM|nr:hypothetical protein IGI04_039907 [Brassica rapa subsp. trilocularis]